MTNEEKVREIENDIVYRENQPIYFMAIREAALKMAEWKDHQFKEYLEKRKAIYENKVSATPVAIVAELNEIINELFKEK